MCPPLPRGRGAQNFVALLAAAAARIFWNAARPAANTGRRAAAEGSASATASASTEVSNTGSSYCSASDNRATSYDRSAAAINSAAVIAAASAILIVGIAVAVIVATSYNARCNDRSTAIYGGSSPPDGAAPAINRPAPRKAASGKAAVSDKPYLLQIVRGGASVLNSRHGHRYHGGLASKRTQYQCGRTSTEAD